MRPFLFGCHISFYWFFALEVMSGHEFWMCQIHEKLVEGEVVGRGHRCDNLGSYEDFTWYVPSHMRPFLFGCHISFYWFFALEVMSGHEFWTHLQTCTELVDLLPPILES